MSKRHQLNRRRSYGRRQHEVRERGERGQSVRELPAAVADGGRHLEARRAGLLDLGSVGGAIGARF